MSTFLQTFQMRKNSVPVPTAVTGNTSAQMNLIIRAHLQGLVNNTLLVSYHSCKLFSLLSKKLRVENTPRPSI